MGGNRLSCYRDRMGPDRGAVLVVHHGVDHGTMGLVHAAARPGKLCLAVGVDDSAQERGRITSRIGDGNDSFSRRAGSLLIGVLDFVFLRAVQTSTYAGFGSMPGAGCDGVNFQVG